MSHPKTFALFLVVGLSLALFVSSGCTPQGSRQSVGPTGSGVKVPISTSSDEARALFIEGRDLAERLRAAEARKFFKSCLHL